LLSESGFSNIGLLHIDLDGNDYFILESLDLSKLNPSIIVMEYNFLFGKERAITTPYDPKFERRVAHFSNLYFGASLAALVHGASRKGYSLVGCNFGGNNAYFVRNDLLNDRIKKQEISVAFKAGKFRQGRDRNYQLMYLSAQRELELIKGLPVINVLTGVSEAL
jgi:hypothetical protein